MKKKHLRPHYLILLAVVMLFTACGTAEMLTNRRKEISTFAIDFRKYTDKGFLFMPDEYFGEYEVKGIITAELHPEVSYVEGHIPAGDDFVVHHFTTEDFRTRTQVIQVPDMEELLDHIYELSIEWGGDAFTHFESSMEVGHTNDSPNASYYYYTISGIVIERR